MERESMDFHERVRHQYLRLADAEPERIVVIDAVDTDNRGVGGETVTRRRRQGK